MSTSLLTLRPPHCLQSVSCDPLSLTDTFVGWPLTDENSEVVAGKKKGWGEENAFVCPKHEQLCQAQCGLFFARYHRHPPVLSRLHNLTSSGCCSCNPLLSCHPLWQLQGLYAEDTFYAVHCPAIPPYYLKSLKVLQVALGQLSSEGTVYHPMSSKFSLRLAYALHCTVPNLENLLYCS